MKKVCWTQMTDGIIFPQNALGSWRSLLVVPWGTRESSRNVGLESLRQWQTDGRKPCTTSDVAGLLKAVIVPGSRLQDSGWQRGLSSPEFRVGLPTRPIRSPCELVLGLDGGGLAGGPLPLPAGAVCAWQVASWLFTFKNGCCEQLTWTTWTWKVAPFSSSLSLEGNETRS